MGSLLKSFFSGHTDKHSNTRVPDGKADGYVSEYTRFITGYLEEHPDVVRDQRYGRLIWWDQHIDLEDWKKAQDDSVPKDGYGFYYLAWLGRTDPKASIGEENPGHPPRDDEAING